MARICFALESFPHLSETFILDQIAALHACGHQIQIVADIFLDPVEQHVEAPLFHLLHREGVPRWRHEALANAVLRSIPGRFWRRTRNLFDSLSDHRFQKYDLVVAHFGPNGLRLAHSRSAGLFDTPLLCIFHGSDVGIPAHDGTIGDYRILFDQAAALLTVNAHFRDLIVTAGAPAELVHVHHMGVAIPKETTKSALKPGSLRLVSVCRLVEKKGLRLQRR